MRAMAWVASALVGCASQPSADAAPTQGDDVTVLPCGTRPPGPVCDGMCVSFECNDPVCSPRCGTACYECHPGVLAGQDWLPVVTDCFCRDAGPDGGLVEDSGDPAAAATTDASMDAS